MIKRNVRANSVRQKMSLIVLLILAVLTVGVITGCSSGSKENKKPLLGGDLYVWCSDDNLGDHYSDWDFIQNNWDTWLYGDGDWFAFFSSEPDDPWITGLTLLNGYTMFFVVNDTIIDYEGAGASSSGFDITVNPPLRLWILLMVL